MKVLELEFDKDVSIKEIKEEMDYYREQGQVVCTKINGEMIYSNDENYEGIMYRLHLGLSESEYNDYSLNIERRYELENIRNKIINLENMPYNRFFYGIFISEIKGAGKIDEFNKWLFFDYDNRIDIVLLASSICLAINGTDLYQIYRNVNDVLRHGDISRDYNYHINLSKALELIRHYTDKGRMVDMVFFKGITESYQLMIDGEFDRLKEEFERKYKK